MEKRVKERLTGALVLVAAIVILVPEMFGGRAERAPHADDAAATKPGDGPPLRSYTIEVEPRAGSAVPASPRGEEPQAQAPLPAEQTAPVPSTAPATAAANAPTPAPAAAAATSPTPSPPHAAASAAATGERGWMVQLGVFSQRANADRLAQELGRKGYESKVDATRGAGGKDMFRVRAGPSGTRDAAVRLQSRLSSDGYKGTLAGPS